MNAAGRLLIDYASAAECVLGTGRVLGDVGQATFVGSETLLIRVIRQMPFLCFVRYISP